MKSVSPIFAMLFAVVLLSSNVLAKCPVGTITVQGNLVDSGDGAMQVTVVAHTPKRDFSGKGAVADGKFRVDVPFNTLKRWSPLFGHNCTNTPEMIEVRLAHGGQLISQKQMNFKDNFETSDSITYRLKHELTLEAAPKPEGRNY